MTSWSDKYGDIGIINERLRMKKFVREIAERVGVNITDMRWARPANIIQPEGSIRPFAGYMLKVISSEEYVNIMFGGTDITDNVPESSATFLKSIEDKITQALVELKSKVS